MLKKVKSILILTVALWGVIGAIHNIADWNGTLGAVGAVTSMSTFAGGADGWQATSSSIVIWAGALFIMLSKLITSVLCAKGGIGMWRAKVADNAAYNMAKHIALAGCGVALIMLFGGFIIVAESWFELWRSESMLGPVLQSAFRYGGFIGLIALFVAAND
tara:strand:+ start:220 stop:702 length:483 start_codon:yes stop_codon:yes gene_type:complete